jgi:hypothetical protein
MCTNNAVFAIIVWAYFPVVFCLYPDTSQRTLEDMDEIFMQHRSVIVCGNGTLTQRARPVELVQAEQRRIAEEQNAMQKGAKGETVVSHVEQV